MAALESRSTTRWASAAVSIVIDQLAHHRVIDACSGGWVNEQSVDLLELTASDRLNPDPSPIDFDFHLAALRETDAVAERTWNYQTSGLVDGSSHGRDTTMNDRA